jgi:hypothetical protein
MTALLARVPTWVRVLPVTKRLALRLMLVLALAATKVHVPIVMKVCA